MVTLLVTSFLIDALFLITLFFVTFLLFRVVLIGLQVSCLLVGEPFVHLCSEALPLVAHLVVHGSVLALCVFFVDFFFLGLDVSLFKFIDNFVLFVSTLLVFEVVHVELIL